MSPSEILAAKIVEKGTGETVIIQTAEGYELVKGIDPGALSQILDVILGFIVGLIDKLREGNLCVKQQLAISIAEVKELSEDEKAQKVIAVAKNPSRLQRARIQVDLKNNLVGLPADPWKMTYSTLDVIADDTNKSLVVESVKEGSDPDFGWI